MNNRYFLVLVLIFSLVSYGMYNIPHDIQQPTHVACLRNKQYVIAGTNGATIFDKKALQSTHFQQDNTIDDLAVNCSKTKIATSSNGVLTVYHAKTGEKEWHHDTNTRQHTPITFNSQHDSELIALIYPDQLQFFTNQYNCETHAILKTMSPLRTKIACHPKKQDITYLIKEPGLFDPEVNTIYVYHKKRIACEKWDCNAENCAISGGNKRNLAYESYHYNTIGYCAVKLNYNGCAFITDATHSVWYAADLPSSPIFHIASAFHPYKPIVALLTDKYLLEFYTLTKDCPFKNRTIIPLTECDVTLDTIDNQNLHLIGKRIAFSPSGKHVVIALANKCIVIPVPFDVLYISATKKQLIHLFWVLKNNRFMTDPLPIDIVRLIFKVQLKVHYHSA